MSIKLTAKQRVDPSDLHLSEKVIHIRRVAKVVAGGRRLSFNAMVVVGDGEGHVGVGLGRAAAVPDAVRKGTAIARKSLVHVPLRGNTVPHSIVCRYGPATVLVKPASPGTGIIAGGAVRAVMEQAGLKDVITKNLGSRNPINVAKAAMTALMRMRALEDDEAWRKGLPRPRATAPTVEPPVPAAPPLPKTPPAERPAQPTPEPAAQRREARTEARASARAKPAARKPRTRARPAADQPEEKPEDRATAPAEEQAPPDEAQASEAEPEPVAQAPQAEATASPAADQPEEEPEDRVAAPAEEQAPPDEAQASEAEPREQEG